LNDDELNDFGAIIKSLHFDSLNRKRFRCWNISAAEFITTALEILSANDSMSSTNVKGRISILSSLTHRSKSSHYNNNNSPVYMCSLDAEKLSIAVIGTFCLKNFILRKKYLST